MCIKEILNVKRRRYVRNAVTKAIRAGTLIKSHACALCKKTCQYTNAHHVDYGKPFEVVWLCSPCHGLVHRKEHPLNPANNPQTAMPYLFDENEQVPVTILLPISSFLEIQKEAEISNIPIARIVKKEIMKKYPIYTQQLEFNFRGKNDHSQQTQYTRISSVVSHEDIVQQSEIDSLQKIWREGSNSHKRMGRQFPEFFTRNGSNAGRLQRARAN